MSIESKLEELKQEDTKLQKQLQALMSQIQSLEQQKQGMLQNLLKIKGGIAALENVMSEEAEKPSIK